MGKNLYQKVFERHTVAKLPSGQFQLFIGLHLCHEATSPQAFAMLREEGQKVLFEIAQGPKGQQALNITAA